jgi:hypothetical protein
MEKLNYKALQVTIALLVCLLIAGTTTSDRPALAALAALPEVSGAGQPQVQVKQLSPGQPGQPGEPEAPVGSGFTYQGSLKSGGNPANAQYDFQFTLYDDLTAGNLVGGPLTTANVTVTGGLFTVTLDFGVDAFTGEARYLLIAVRQTGGGTYTTLTPRQALTPAPYALSLRPGAVISGTNGTIFTAQDNSTNPLSSGVDGYSQYGSGVYGGSTNGIGVEGHSDNYFGVYGNSTNSSGVYGYSINNEGVHGTTSSNFAGVYGYNSSTGGIGPGVRGDGNSGPGVYGISTSGWAGFFEGNVHVTGTCCAAAEGTYRIDHPLDPANKYLNQSAVESPDMKTIYDGIATLDAAGEAWVDMPSYSQSLNQDFRYQLTPIGAPGRDLYIAQEIQDNRFKIAGGKASMKVSWQVTGIRHDPYAVQNPVTVEQDKPADEKGKYLHPEVYSQPETMGIGYEQSQSAKQPQQLPPATPGR